MLHIWASVFLHGVFRRKSFHPCSNRSNPPKALCRHNKRSKQHANLCSDLLLEQRLPWILGRHDHHTTRKWTMSLNISKISIMEMLLSADVVWSLQVFMLNLGFISLFSRRENGVKKQFELNFFLEKRSSEWSKSRSPLVNFSSAQLLTLWMPTQTQALELVATLDFAPPIFSSQLNNF